MASKYIQGHKQISLNDLIFAYKQGDILIYVDKKCGWRRNVVSPSIFMGMTLKTVMQYIDCGFLSYAIKITKVDISTNPMPI